MACPRAVRTALCCWLLAAAAARKLDQDFEFDDDAEAESAKSAGHAHRPRRYVYDPHNGLCSALQCKKRELCLLRDANTALCQDRKDVLRRGDVIVSAASASGDEDADDVFYESGARDPPPPAPDRCVGCGGWGGGASGGGGGGGGFLCGSDNRTYSSLCRLDLHNCVRRPAPPVALACRGFCPCAGARGRARRPRPRTRARARRPHDPAHNEVLPERRRRPAPAACALDEMADRLLDWFSVLMEEEEGAGAPPPRAGFPADCKPEVRWMFGHLDADGDGALSARDLYALRHDERERCLRPFLASCGGGGGGVTRAGWCGCLARAARPCTALARAHGGAAAAGGYVPACDARGYYRARQCHAALGVCWCVDAHGAEVAGSRVRGEPACRAPGPPPAPPADDEDAPQGSGDGDLRY